MVLAYIEKLSMHNSQKLIDSYLFKWKCMELPKMQLHWQPKKQESESLFDDIILKEDWRLPTIEELLRVKETGFKGFYFSSTLKNENTVYGVFFGKGKEKVEIEKNKVCKVRLCKDKKASVPV